MYTQPAQKAYLDSLKFHFDSLKSNWDYHKGSEEIYIGLFDILHNLAEGESSMEDPQEVSPKGLYNNVEKFKNFIKGSIKEEEDEGMKNRLISAYENLQILCSKILSLDYDNELYDEE